MSQAFFVPGLMTMFPESAMVFVLPLGFGMVLVSAVIAIILARRLRRSVKKSDAVIHGTVLAIGAHPDDIEFGCGAALLRYHENGFRTHGIVLTNGENGIAGSNQRQSGLPVRYEEAHRGGQIMQLDSLTLLNFPDGQLSTRSHEIKSAIEDLVKRYQPDVVFTHNNLDLHSDHRLVFDATIEACRNVPTVLCYENPNTPPEFRPNLFVDVSQWLDKKIKALSCHSSQTGKDYFSPELIRSMARVRGNQAKVSFAEGFIAVRVRFGGE